MKHDVYVYPELSDKDFGWFRLSGPGLANCLFIAARAYILSKELNAHLISPTWEKLSIGPILRGESDKRHYIGLFRRLGVCGWKKIILLMKAKLGYKQFIKVAGLKNYFYDFRNQEKEVRKYIENIIVPRAVRRVDRELIKDSIAVHIRLGDYVQSNRIPIQWYIDIIKNINNVAPNRDILIFSDGTDEELKPVTSLPNAKRVFYGNALADIYAISSCSMVIASDSTFSAWGAFLGAKPIIFSKRHFMPVYSQGAIPEFVLNESTSLPDDIISYLQNN